MNISYTDPSRLPTVVKYWLLTGLLMVALQIVIGGVTRLTGSGLSITKWQIVTGTIPPLNETQWASEFDLYKQTPQFQKLNSGMSMSDFKFIYFWEYFHRLWARLMFVVFIIPFFWFLFRGLLSRPLLPRLVTLVLLAGLEGFFGWIMVASGLTSRPWVNAYNLTLHLSMGFIIFGHLLWTVFMAYMPGRSVAGPVRLRQLGHTGLLVAGLQIALGALMSGTKAGLHYPTWPDMNGTFIPALLLDPANWQAHFLIEYDSHAFMPTLVQVLHRNTAYILVVVLVILFVRTRPWFGERRLALAARLMFVALWTQVVLGILTVLHCAGSIPVLLGELHQIGALLLVSSLLYYLYLLYPKPAHAVES